MMDKITKIIVILCAVYVFVTVPSSLGAEEVEFVLGTAAFVDKIVDGDTIRVRAEVWPGVVINTAVRIMGIDTPETRRPKCDEEKTMGDAATRALARLVPVHSVVILSAIKNGKFAGRVIAQVLTPEGVDVGVFMLDGGYARPYSGRGPRPDWCVGVADG